MALLELLEHRTDRPRAVLSLDKAWNSQSLPCGNDPVRSEHFAQRARTLGAEQWCRSCCQQFRFAQDLILFGNVGVLVVAKRVFPVLGFVLFDYGKSTQSLIARINVDVTPKWEILAEDLFIVIA